MAAPTLFFIRHGETDWNIVGRLQGQRDNPINAVGRQQAAEAGRRLRTVGAVPESMDWQVSPMARTRETAELARDAVGLRPTPYRMDDRLKELTFGKWEGLTWPELRKIDPVAADAREADKWGYVPPGGESYAMLADRVAGWLAEVREDTIVVSHGGVARVLMVLIGGLDPGDAAHVDIWQGKVLVFKDGTSRWG